MDAFLQDISVAGDRAARSKALERVVKDYSGVLIQSITVALTATSRFVLSVRELTSVFGQRSSS